MCKIRGVRSANTALSAMRINDLWLGYICVGKGENKRLNAWFGMSVRGEGSLYLLRFELPFQSHLTPTQFFNDSNSNLNFLGFAWSQQLLQYTSVGWY